MNAPQQNQPFWGYMDYNATSPMRPEVLGTMERIERKAFGNPNSIHGHGVQARYEVEKARKQLAQFIGARKAEEVIFTGGGTEADNLALRGACFAARRQGRGNHLILPRTEHKAVLDVALELDDQHGFEATYLETDEFGRTRAEDLKKALRPDTVLVSIMAANNEIGSLNAVAELAAIVHSGSRALFHTDAIQMLGRLPFNVADWDADLVSLSAHKCHGPKGVGALYIRDGVSLEPLISGGGQERGHRAGTENVSGIAAFAEAARLSVKDVQKEMTRMAGLREQLWERLVDAIPHALRNSPVENCLPNTLHISLPGSESRELVRELDREGFAVSSGSACTSKGEALSHVLLATGAGEERAKGALRLSLGRYTGEDEIPAFVESLKNALDRMARKEHAVG